MRIDWKHLWGEAAAVAGVTIYFLTPSFQAYMAAHPGTKIATLMAILITLGLKQSPVQKGA